MSEPSSRVMLAIDFPQGRLNLRAAAIVLREGHVLVHQGNGENHWTLPGGRVELFEPSSTALQRELEEELAETTTIGPLRFLVESFFSHEGHRFHELGFYYAVALSEKFPFALHQVVHEIEDGVHLSFRWVAADPESLAAINFVPAALRPLLRDTASEMLHIIQVEP